MCTYSGCGLTHDYGYKGKFPSQDMKNTEMILTTMRIKRLCWERTFAGLDALGPCVIKLCAAGIPTLIEPSATTSATAEFAGFLNGAALGAALTAYRGCTCRRICFCGHANVGITQNLKPRHDRSIVCSLTRYCVYADKMSYFFDIGHTARLMRQCAPQCVSKDC